MIRPFFKEIQNRLGFGALQFRRGNAHREAQVLWFITRKSDCARLVDLFQAHPLRAKKRRDFEIWKEGVALWASMRGNGRPHRNWMALEILSEQLRRMRQFDPFEQDEGEADPQLELMVNN